MKVGVIGIGDIAQKAYLPILSTRTDIDLYIASRNQQVVHEVGEKYRIHNCCATVQELIQHKVDVAFVHAATEAHVEILRELITAGIHVFVDKPIAYTLQETEEIMTFAKEKGVRLMVGFNRRFAPMHRDIKEEVAAFDTIFMQKNRVYTLSDVRTTIFDDFIHVVDTLLFYLGEPRDVTVHGKIEDGRLHYLVLNMFGGTTSATGMMNRHTGVTDERLEVMGDEKKIVVDGLIHGTTFVNNTEQRRSFGSWDTTLYQRGFDDMIEHFLTCVKNDEPFLVDEESIVRTHRVCEVITRKLEEQ
ncbi:Gfo/Idh/MocA family protein [Priestia taiwanensis]|uniref:Dehydrogenase n=1 Tax=Priestia taiwanensis TaxID=1347902 RepID=A0A917AP36_9BACI|nr:Gfo/Idh/MocA family oxidoreductase [Priestia taiwanensis]MBM7362603.1 virulence factor [Priestia taiwanensis]GGE63595.1 dehydrogenase [Priestia taiwanensis]